MTAPVMSNDWATDEAYDCASSESSDREVSQFPLRKPACPCTLPSSSLTSSTSDESKIFHSISHPQPRQALPVSDTASSSHSGAPLTAAAYLASVRTEAASFPTTFIAPARPPSQSLALWPSATSTSTILQPPAHAVPPAPWARSLLSAFARLQHEVSRRDAADIPGARELAVPRAKDVEAWRKLCWEANGPTPQVAVVSRLDYVRVVAGLKCFDGWLQPADLEGGEIGCRAAKSLRVGFRAYWLFALLASLFV